MKVYVDLVFLLNFVFDFLLLLTTASVLRRKVKWKRFFFGALIGSTSIFLLFFSMLPVVLFCFKFGISVLMILGTFGYRDKVYFFRNLVYLYMVSVVLGGFLYFLNVQFSYAQEGIVFYHKGVSINVIFLVLFAPIILYTYVRLGQKQKELYANMETISFSYHGSNYTFTGFIDTGNQLKDPYFHRPVILVEENKIKHDDSNYIYVPYHTAHANDLLRCIEVREFVLSGVRYKRRILVGFMKQKIGIDGVDAILSPSLKGE